MVRRGELVEFTDDDYSHYPPVDASKIRFGVCIEDTDLSAGNGSCRVEISSGEIVIANYVWTYAWSGWMPDDLLEIYHKYNATREDFED